MCYLKELCRLDQPKVVSTTSAEINNFLLKWILCATGVTYNPTISPTLSKSCQPGFYFVACLCLHLLHCHIWRILLYFALQLSEISHPQVSTLPHASLTLYPYLTHFFIICTFFVSKYAKNRLHSVSSAHVVISVLYPRGESTLTKTW